MNAPGVSSYYRGQSYPTVDWKTVAAQPQGSSKPAELSAGELNRQAVLASDTRLMPRSGKSFSNNTFGQAQSRNIATLVTGPAQQAQMQYAEHGGTGNPLLDSIMESIDSANAANEARFNEAKGLLQGSGEAGKMDINQRFESRLAANQQDMISRGLSGTTVGPSMAMGMERDRSRELGALQERVNQQMVGLLASKTDAGPDMSTLMQLAQMQGQGSITPSAGSAIRMGGSSGAVGSDWSWKKQGGSPLDEYMRMKNERLARERGGQAGAGINIGELWKQNVGGAGGGNVGTVGSGIGSYLYPEDSLYPEGSLGGSYNSATNTWN